MKYIDAEKLKAEIERVKAEKTRIYEMLPKDDLDAVLSYAQRECLKQLSYFITSLQQEQPDNEDIDKVAQELYEHLYELKRRNSVPTNLYEKQEIIDLWKAGIEYAYNHPKQEQPEVDLEKEMDKFYDSPLWDGEDVSWMTYTRIASHFYELGLNARK